MRDLYEKFDTQVLPNGLSVHSAYIAGAPLCIRILIHSGARHDPRGLEGTAHFLEHAVTIGKEELTKDHFKENGGSVDLGGTGLNSIQYACFIRPETEIVAGALETLGALLLDDPLVHNLETERKVILAEYKEDFPRKSKFNTMIRSQEMLYHDSVWGRFMGVLGSKDSIKRISRNNLEVFREEHYVGANMSIVALGGMKIDELAELLLKSPFGKRKRGRRADKLTPRAEFPPPLETHYSFAKSKYLAEDSEGADYHTYGRIPGTTSFEAIRVFESLVDRNLFTALRIDEGCAYKTLSTFGAYGDCYAMDIELTELDPQTLERTERTVDRAIARVAEDEESFVRERRYAIARVRMVEKTMADLCEEVAERLVLEDTIPTFAEIERSFRAVTMEDMRFIASYLRPQMRWTHVAPP